MATEKIKTNSYVRETALLYWDAMARYPRMVLVSALMPLGTILLTVAVPFYAGKILAGIAQATPNLNWYIVGFGVSALAGIIFSRFGFTSLMVLQARSLADLHGKVFDRLLRRSVGYHANNISGKLVSDAIDFMTAYGTLSNALIVNALPFLLSLIIGLIVVFIGTWQLGLFLAFIVTVTLVWAGIESQRRAELRNIRLLATKKLTAHLADSIVNAQTIKTFSQETHEIHTNSKLNSVLMKLRIRDWQRAARSGSNRIATLLLMQFFMILLIVHLARTNPETLAAGIFAFTYTLTLSNRLFEINTLTRQIEESFLQASPITAMLQEKVEIQDAPGAIDLRVTSGAIDLNSISFSYPDSTQEATVFSGLELHVSPGERIGLVGPSGGGKSTLTRLLLRFDDVDTGSITIDGQDLSAVTQGSLRANISYVPQEPLLFHRSIRENIAYGKTEATDEDVIAAAKKANAHEFISSLPEGYGTIVGERGVKLSGGQRQRVAIARAILKDAPILVLDEATSALDSESEVLIQQALWKLMKGRTAIVIAHRLSTIQKMDRIVVLDGGTIAEQGSHQELLKRKGGLYAKLWSHQSGGFIEE